MADPRTAIVGTTTSADLPGADMAQHLGVDIFVYNPVTHSTIVLGGSGDDIATLRQGHTQLRRIHRRVHQLTRFSGNRTPSLRSTTGN
jgi:hypothetical protein